jgi:hypothetical protein
MITSIETNEPDTIGQVRSAMKSKKVQKKRNARTLRKWKVYQPQAGISNPQGSIPRHFSYINPNFRKP